MSRSQGDLDLSEAVQYHYDKFPPKSMDFGRLLAPLSKAAASLARYDQMLKGLHNSEIMLAPLRSQEAVVSSRMEGTISTLDEVLRYEAEQEGDGDQQGVASQSEAAEVYLYSRAMRDAQAAMGEGAPLSPWLIRSAHKALLGFGRGASLSPGEFKTGQNYLADRGRRKVLFVPISPERLVEGMERLFSFIQDDDCEILIRTAVSHLEFEALHPFKDGNGRIGRMLIPLMLWRAGALSQPYFYISGYLEEKRDDYIDLMRAVSEHDDWTSWIIFFLEALDAQANRNLQTAEEIRTLYEAMKVTFRDGLSSQWSTTALDFVFGRPVFFNTTFTARSGIPAQTAHRLTNLLADKGLLKVLRPASGRRPALYAFEPLLKIVRGSS
jgi:hypothetical protein